LQEQLSREFPDQPQYQRELATSYSRLGPRLQRFHPAEAEKVFRQALGIREKIAEQHPGVVGDQEMFGDGIGQLVSYLMWENRELPEAEKLIHRRLEIQKKIVDDLPGVAVHRHMLAYAYHDLADWQEKARRWPEAERTARQVLDLREKLAADF